MSMISVGSAGKVGEGVNAYFVYKVCSDMFSIEPLEVDRRYSDFLWLHNQVQTIPLAWELHGHSAD